MRRCNLLVGTDDTLSESDEHDNEYDLEDDDRDDLPEHPQEQEDDEHDEDDDDDDECDRSEDELESLLLTSSLLELLDVTSPPPHVTLCVPVR